MNDSKRALHSVRDSRGPDQLEVGGRVSRRSLLTAATLSSVLPQALAQPAGYPQRPVRIIVPGAAGGPLDVFARRIGQRFAELAHQPFVVENRNGAGGSVGAKAAAQAAPDGYTLLAAFSGPIVVNPYLHANTGYTKADFASIGLISSTGVAIVVPAASPIKTLDDLVTRGKKPGAGFYSTGGNGSMGHVCGSMLCSVAGLSYGHIPYNGGPPAAQAVLAGEVTWGLMDVGNAMPLVADGRVRALAVSSKNRSSLWPTVPSLNELGYRQIDLSIWHALLAPAKTPQPVIQQLNAWLVQVLADPGMQANLRRLGYEPAADNSPANLDRLLEVESGVYANIIRTAGIKVE